MLVIRWIFSSIVNEVIRTIYLFFVKTFYTQKKPTKHPSNVYSDIFYTLKSIIKHTTFPLDIMPKSIKKANNVYSDILIRLKKMHKNSGSWCNK